MAFNHEKLRVYQRTLLFNTKVGAWLAQWDKKHAVCDQLARAAGSMLENIAMASAAYSAMKQRSLDYAIGSTLECAACLDLARVKRLIDGGFAQSEKEELSQIMRMLVGLRRSWSGAGQVVREELAEYGMGSRDGKDDEVFDKARDKVWEEKDDKVCDKARDKVWEEKILFHHERLDVYRVAIRIAEVFSSAEAVCRLSNPVFRRLDELLTSMVLNIAEGNGRFSDADQRRFLGTSHEAAIKLAARLDLCVSQNLLARREVDKWKDLLERVAGMTSGMIAKLGG
jgi:four helix bundle protein